MTVPHTTAPPPAERAELDKKVFNFVRDLATNYDHREDAHRYGTSCFVCDAETLLAALHAAPQPVDRAGGEAREMSCMSLREELAAALWRAMQDGYERACDDRPIMIDLAFARADDRLALITTAALAELRSAAAGAGEVMNNER
jgi:hypothetical protein